MLMLVGVWAIVTLVQATVLWLAAKLTRVEGAFVPFLIICVICNLIGLVPGLGGILNVIAYFALLKYSTGADSWGDILLLVVVAAGLRFLTVISLLPMLEKMSN